VVLQNVEKYWTRPAADGQFGSNDPPPVALEENFGAGQESSGKGILSQFQREFQIAMDPALVLSSNESLQAHPLQSTEFE
jgi:hypothetical protein